jgi:hypothetical protein
LAVHVQHVLDAVDFLFERRGNSLGERLRIRARIRRRNDDGGRSDIGILRDRTLGERKLGDLNEFMRRSGLMLKFDEPPRHRAEADARRLALALCSRW